MTGAERDRPRDWLLRFARTMTLRQLVLAVTGLAVLVSGLFGGLATATADGPAELEPGTAVDAAPLEITVERLRSLTDLGPTVADPRGRYIGAVATVRNTSDHPVHLGVIREALTLVGVEGLDPAAAPQVLVVADSTPLSSAAAGLTYEVVYLWDQDATADPPSEATVAVQRHTWRQSTIDDQFLWLDPVVTHEGRFEVREASRS